MQKQTNNTGLTQKTYLTTSSPYYTAKQLLIYSLQCLDYWRGASRMQKSGWNERKFALYEFSL